VTAEAIAPGELEEEAHDQPKVRRRRSATRAPAASRRATADDAPVHERIDEEGGTQAAATAKEESSDVKEALTEALAPPFNVAAAKTAMGAAAGNASACGDGTASGSAKVSVTFSHAGSATAAVVDPASSLAGTSVAGCIASVMRTTKVPAYSGETVTVRSRVTIRSREADE
jgi:hypothetical protein